VLTVLSLILAAALSQVPADPPGQVAVVLSTRRAHVDPLAAKIAAKVHAALINEGVDSPLEAPEAAKRLKALGYSDPRKCEGSTSCLGRLAKLLGPRAIIVGVDVGQVARSVVIHVDAVSAEQSEAFGSVDVTSGVDQWMVELSAPLTALARKVGDRRLGVPAPPPTPSVPEAATPDAPVRAVAEETPPSPPPLPSSSVSDNLPLAGAAPAAAVAQTAPRKSRAAPIALAGGAVVALGAAGVFTALGLHDMQTVNASRYTLGGQTASTLPQSQLDSLSNSANGRFTIALSAGLVGAALGVASAFLFAKD
jgi:hypothetical protein